MQRFSLHTRNFSLHTSDKELKDLLIAWIIISISFAIVENSGSGFSAYIQTRFLTTIIISAITVGLAFLLHELAHKVVAQKYHCWAEFRADFRMLILALIMSFIGFVFIAPGAVMIFGNIDKRQNGIISMAGPLTNIVLAIILLPFMFITTSALWQQIITSGYLINAWLALFNMIPFLNFDGAKIYRWNKAVYIGMIIVSAFLVFIFFVK